MKSDLLWTPHADLPHAERIAGVEVPHAHEPFALAPVLRYKWNRGTNAAGNPLWRNLGTAGSAGDAVGAGGAANPTPLTAGYPGYSFDGGDRMDIAAANNASGSCWWEAWLYPTNAATSRIIYHNTMTSLVDYLIVGAIAGPSFLASARGAASNSMSCALTLNTWQHILVQRSGLFITAIYKNGVSSGGAAGAAFGGGALNAHIIGCYSTGALFYIGSIGEMGFHLGTVRATLPRHLYESTRHEYGV